MLPSRDLRQSGTRAAAGTSGITVQIPRVTRSLKLMGKPSGAKLRHVQFAQEDSPCGFDFRDYGSIFIRDKVCEYRGPKGSTNTFSINLVLYRHGNAVHGT